MHTKHAKKIKKKKKKKNIKHKQIRVKFKQIRWKITKLANFASDYFRYQIIKVRIARLFSLGTWIMKQEYCMKITKKKVNIRYRIEPYHYIFVNLFPEGQQVHVDKPICISPWAHQVCFHILFTFYLHSFIISFHYTSILYFHFTIHNFISQFSFLISVSHFINFIS